jgi:hypothetical protein
MATSMDFDRIAPYPSEICRPVIIDFYINPQKTERGAIAKSPYWPMIFAHGHFCSCVDLFRLPMILIRPANTVLQLSLLGSCAWNGSFATY